MNGMRAFSPPTVNVNVNVNGTRERELLSPKPQLNGAYYPHEDYINQQSDWRNGQLSPTMQPNGDFPQFNDAPDAYDDDMPQNDGGGMTRSDRFGTTTLFDPGRGDERLVDDAFELPNPIDAPQPNGYEPQPNGYEPPADNFYQYGTYGGAYEPLQQHAHMQAPRPNQLQLAVDNRPFSPARTPAILSPNQTLGPRPVPPSRPFSPAAPSIAPSRAPGNTLRASQGDKSVQMGDAIELLSSGNDAVRSHAAAYIQHLLYRDEDAKARCRMMNGIPKLVRVVETGRPETVRAGLGVLLNVSTGRSNDDNKRAIVQAGGVDVLLRLLTTPQDSADVHELVTGVLWNVATCRDARRSLLDHAVQPLVDCVVKPHAESAFQLLQQVRVLANELAQGQAAANGGPSADLAQRTYELRVANQQTWSTVLRNATGALRCVSADGESARRKLRETRFLVSSLLVFVRLAIETREFANDRDNKVIENTVSILRNVSYALQELADPTYTKRRRDEEAQLLSGAARPTNPPPTNDQEKVTCFRASKKVSANSSDSRTPNVIPPPTLSANDDLAQLWNPETVRLYQSILAECCNPQTIEAAAGTLQNLTACEWQPSVDIRTQLRKEKGLPILVDLLNLNTDSIVLATVLCLRNLIVDQRNKELISKHALPQLVGKLPLDERDVQNDARSRYCTVNDLSQTTLAAILATLHEVVVVPSKQELAEAERLRKRLDQQAARRRPVNGLAPPAPGPEEEFLAASIKQNNPAFARSLLDSGCIPRLFFIVRSAPSGADATAARQRFDPKVIRFSQAVLYQLWLYPELRSEYSRRGWIERDFIPSTSAPHSMPQSLPQSQPQPPVPATNSSAALTLNATVNRNTMQPVSAATMRSQTPALAAPPPPPSVRPVMSRVGSPTPVNIYNGPYAYSNTIRTNAPPPRSLAGTLRPPMSAAPPIGGPGAGNTYSSNDRQNLLTSSSRQLAPGDNGNGTMANYDVNYGPQDIYNGANTMPRPGGTLGNMPREAMLSQGTLAAVRSQMEPTYTRVDKRPSQGPQSYDPASAGNTVGRGQGAPYSSTLQLVPSRPPPGSAPEEPVADSWV